MRSRPLPPADRLHTGRFYGNWRAGVSSVPWRRTAQRDAGEGGRSPPRNVQETAWNLDGRASVHRTVGRLKTLPCMAAARGPRLRDSTVTGSSTPPYHTPSRDSLVRVVAALREVTSVAGPGTHGPPARRSLDDLQQRGRDLEEAPTHLENRLKRIEPRDPVPRPAAELQVPVGPQASPHPSHRVTSVRLALIVSRKRRSTSSPPVGPAVAAR